MTHKIQVELYADEESAKRASLNRGQPGYSERYLRRGPTPKTNSLGETVWEIEVETYSG